MTQVTGLEVVPHEWWEARRTRHGSDPSRHRAFAEWVVSTLDLKPGSVVMEVAGGKGTTSLELLKLGMKPILVEPAPHAGSHFLNLRFNLRLTLNE